MLTPNNTAKVLLVFILLILVLGSQLLVLKGVAVFSKDCIKQNKKFVVKHVFDGDTILIENSNGVSAYRRNGKREFKVRLLGIDAFEYDQLPYGKSAKDFLTMLLVNKKVCIETDVQEKDIYERTLGYVFLNNLVFINEELLKNGQALLYNFPPNIKYIDKLKAAQIYARQNMLGIWEKQNYILETPYQFRKRINKKSRLRS